MPFSIINFKMVRHYERGKDHWNLQRLFVPSVLSKWSVARSPSPAAVSSLSLSSGLVLITIFQRSDLIVIKPMSKIVRQVVSLQWLQNCNYSCVYIQTVKVSGHFFLNWEDKYIQCIIISMQLLVLTGPISRSLSHWQLSKLRGWCCKLREKGSKLEK